MFAYIYLNDGSSFTIMKGTCIDFVFDINGNRKPNVEVGINLGIYIARNLPQRGKNQEISLPHINLPQ